jgi:hypothetical protein
MLPCLLLSSVALATSNNPDAAKIFSDKGSTYFRTNNHKALTVGAELETVSDAQSTASVGKAVIMEVNGQLARVSLDDESTKAGAKFVLLPKGKVVAMNAISPEPELGEKPSSAPKLDGTLEVGALRVSWANNSDQSWTSCVLVYNDGRKYNVGEAVKHADDAVMRVKFSSAPEAVYDHLTVSCDEGIAKFFFAKPNAPQGSLKGYATNEGKGSVMLYNNNDTAWTSCDVKKPDGTHYVLGTLKGHDSDSIDRGRFIREASAPGKEWIELRCQQGVIHTALN